MYVYMYILKKKICAIFYINELNEISDEFFFFYVEFIFFPYFKFNKLLI